MRAQQASERALAIVRSLVTAREQPARWIAASARARGVSDTVRLRALRALIASGEIEALGQTWTRRYRKKEKQGDE